MNCPALEKLCAEASDATPRVSVIMIFLNCRAFIAEAIGSVRSQSFNQWELVLVDDGSDDGSYEVAATLAAADPARVRLVQHPDRGNHGTGASRNLGLSHCRGEFVAFLDADDVYLPNRLQRHVELLDRHPEVSLVQGPVQMWFSWYGDGKQGTADNEASPLPVAVDQPIEPPGLLTLLIRSKGYTHPAINCLTFRAADVRRLGGFNASFRHAYEDTSLLAKTYLECVTLVTGEVLARYRQHPQSLVHRLERQGLYVPGRPNPAHRAFMEWLQDYVSLHPNSSDTLRSAVRAELWPYAHPWAWSMQNLPHLLLRRLRDMVSRVLPAGLIKAVLERRGRQKEARAAERTSKIARDVGVSSRPIDPEERT